MNLQARWTQLFGNNPESLNIWSKVEKEYSKKFRKYHNLDHLYYMFKMLDEYFPDLKNNKCLNFAIFLHDFKYSIFSRSNEIHSAKVSSSFLQQLGFSNEDIKLVYDLIISTKDHKASAKKRIFDVFIDLDFSIFAGSANEYLSYAHNIRREYRHFPNFYYRKNRILFLENILKREQIFLTNELKHQEQIARRNIQSEIDSNCSLKDFEFQHLIPINIIDSKLIRTIPVNNKPYYKTEISFDEIDRIFAFKIDCLTYDDIIIQIDFKGSQSLLLSEEAKGFPEFCEQLGNKIEGCRPFEKWYFEVMMPPFETSFTPIYNCD